MRHGQILEDTVERYTTIRVPVSLSRALKAYGGMDDRMEDVLRRLLAEAQKAENRRVREVAAA